MMLRAHPNQPQWQRTKYALNVLVDKFKPKTFVIPKHELYHEAITP
jgi:hypothetical protein